MAQSNKYYRAIQLNYYELTTRVNNTQYVLDLYTKLREKYATEFPTSEWTDNISQSYIYDKNGKNIDIPTHKMTKLLDHIMTLVDKPEIVEYFFECVKELNRQDYNAALEILSNQGISINSEGKIC